LWQWRFGLAKQKPHRRVGRWGLINFVNQFRTRPPRGATAARLAADPDSNCYSPGQNNEANRGGQLIKCRFFPKSQVDTPAHICFHFQPFVGKFMYAVLETGSKQYRVAAGDTVEIERLEIEAGKPVTFDRVLLVNTDGKVSVGAPTVSGATVLADVVEHKRGEKKLTFKMKRRKGYHKSIGHRQELTVVKIKEIKA
jgi:large subunit ribosomal protein L21